MIHLAGSGITVVIAWIILKAGIDFLPMNVRIEVATMLSIAMPQARCRKTFTVVVNHHRTKHNLVASVPVHVGYSEVVIALSLPRTICVVVPSPAQLQLVSRRIHVVCHHLVARINASCQEDTGLVSIQIRCAKEILRTAVSVAVAPSSVEVVFTTFQSCQRICDALIWLARLAIHIDKILGTIVHEPVRATARISPIIQIGISNGENRSVCLMNCCAVSSTNHHFCLSIAVPVVADDIDFIVLEVAHVRTAVHPPQHRTIHLQAFQKRMFTSDNTVHGRTILWITLRDLAVIVIFQQNLQFAITVHISTASIVGHVCTQQRGIVLWSDFLVARSPRFHSLTRFLFHATHHCCNGV